MTDEDSRRSEFREGGGGQPQDLMDVLRWLRKVEELAAQVYGDVAQCYGDDKQVAGFLSELAEDEAWHYHLIGSACDVLAEAGESPRSEVAVDEATRERIEKPLRELRDAVATSSSSPAHVFDCISRVEFSEWNDIFLYVILSCQEHSKTFQTIAATIQAHKKRVDTYIDALPEELRPSYHPRSLQAIWKGRILVVDDHPVIRELLEAVLSEEAEVTTASDGQEALDKVSESYFDVIISDFEMPVMNGGEFFRLACAADAELPKRFIFCSGAVGDEVKVLSERHGAKYLPKPLSFAVLREMVESILAQAE
jgi:two-component system, chemotaxis family, chemotaxis protein CheY